MLANLVAERGVGPRGAPRSFGRLSLALMVGSSVGCGEAVSGVDASSSPPGEEGPPAAEGVEGTAPSPWVACNPTGPWTPSSDAPPLPGELVAAARDCEGTLWVVTRVPSAEGSSGLAVWSGVEVLQWQPAVVQAEGETTALRLQPGLFEWGESKLSWSASLTLDPAGRLEAGPTAACPGGGAQPVSEAELAEVASAAGEAPTLGLLYEKTEGTFYEPSRELVLLRPLGPFTWDDLYAFYRARPEGPLRRLELSSQRLEPTSSHAGVELTYDTPEGPITVTTDREVTYAQIEEPEWVALAPTPTVLSSFHYECRQAPRSGERVPSWQMAQPAGGAVPMTCGERRLFHLCVRSASVADLEVFLESQPLDVEGVVRGLGESSSEELAGLGVPGIEGAGDREVLCTTRTDFAEGHRYWVLSIEHEGRITALAIERLGSEPPLEVGEAVRLHLEVRTHPWVATDYLLELRGPDDELRLAAGRGMGQAVGLPAEVRGWSVGEASCWAESQCFSALGQYSLQLDLTGGAATIPFGQTVSAGGFEIVNSNLAWSFGPLRCDDAAVPSPEFSIWRSGGG